MKRLLSNKKFLGATSLVLATSLAVGTMAFRKSNEKKGLEAITSPSVLADANVVDFDAASAVNYSTVLRRAIDYGILSKKLTQISHMETTFATSYYSNTEATNNDIDLAGDMPAQFIIADVKPGDIVRFGQTYHQDGDTSKPCLPMTFVIDTTPQLVQRDLFTYDNSFVGDHLYRTYEKDELDKNIDSMLDHIKTQSTNMLNKGAFDADSLLKTMDGKQVIDLDSDEYENATVYINVEAGSKLLASLKKENDLKIKKRSSTVVVFNVLEKTALTLGQYIVEVDNKEIRTFTNDSGNSTAHNDDVDKEIARKIIWNIPYAKTINYNTTAGTFLVTNPQSVGYILGSSAGWIASAGETIVKDAEFHYIFKDRSPYANTDDTSYMHFATAKAFSSTVPIEQRTDIFLEAGDYTLSYQETKEDYTTTVGEKKTVTNDANGKFVFPTLKIDVADVDPLNGITKYFVIKEDSKKAGLDNVHLSDGEIDIRLRITNINGIIHYVIDYYSYLTHADKLNNNPYMVENDVAMSGTEFTLFEFYNIVDVDSATLKLKKELGSSVDPNKTYKVAVKKGLQYVQDEQGKLSGKEHFFELTKDQELTITGLRPGDYTVVEEESSVPGYDLVETKIYVNGGESALDPNGEYPTTNLNLVKDETKNVVISNTYEEKNLDGKVSLNLSKVVVIDGTEKTELPSGFAGKKIKLTVQVASGPNNGKYVVSTNGDLASQGFLYLEMGKTLTIYGLDPDTQYAIIEDANTARVSGYTLTAVNGNTTNVDYAPISVYTNQTENKQEIRNEYVSDKGSLKLTKDFKINGNSISQNITGKENLKFTVIGPDGTDPIYLTWTDFLPNGEWTRDNLPVGDYTIIEEGSELTSGTVDDNGVSRNVRFARVEKGSAIVRKDAVTDVGIVNIYEFVYDQEVLIKKSVDGLPNNLIKGEYKVAIINEDGEYYTETVDSNNTVVGYTFSNTPYYVSVPGDGTPFISQRIPVGTYQLEEDMTAAKVDGYEVRVAFAGDTRTSSFVLNSNNRAQIQVINYYSKYSLEVKKDVTGQYPYDNTEYTFYVKKVGTTQYVGNDGRLVNTPYPYTITKDQTVKIPVYEAGEYEVIEEKAGQSENNHFILVTTYEVLSDPSKSEVTIDDSHMTDTIKITNDYTYKHEGSLEIVKTITGDGYDPDKTYPITVEFDTPVAYSVNGADPITTPSTTYSTSIKAGAANSVTLSKIPVGTKCRVIEADSALTGGYALVNLEYYDGDTKVKEVSSNYDQDTAYVELSGDLVAHKAVVNNKYVAPTGYIRITKSIYGLLSNLSKQDKENLTFVVKDQAGTEIWRGNLGDTTKFSITDPGNGYYVTYQSVKIPVTDLSKSYTVTEELTTASAKYIFVWYTVDGSEYTERRDETNRDPITTVPFSIDPDETKELVMKDTYHVFDVKVAKHVEGTDARDQLFKIVVEFTPPANGTIDWDTVLILNPYEANGASYILDRDTNTVTCYLKGDQYINIRRLPVDATYDAYEDLTGISNYVTRTIEYCDGKKTVDDWDYGPDCIDVYNKYEPKGKLIFTKTVKGPVTQAEAEGGLTFQVYTMDGTTKKYIQLDGSLSETAYTFKLTDEYNGKKIFSV
ncbi:MAG: hypothetical protein J5752_05810, partial [Clostridiales bacterium]|nr:hypothetical protein [Clostridiales bacterium]